MNKKIAYVTDIHLDEQFPIDQGIDARANWKVILEDIYARGIDEIIFGGDIGEKAANQWFFDSLRNYELSITLGNHDYFNEVIKYYDFEILNQQTELYYSQERKDYKLIFLDSSAGSISQAQFDWFRLELLSAKRILVFIHHPILAVDAEVDKRFGLIDRDRMKEELLKVEGEVVVICGHYHFEDEITYRNIRQYITPASSYQVVKIPDEIKVNTDAFGYRIIELKETGMKTDLVTFT